MKDDMNDGEVPDGGAWRRLPHPAVLALIGVCVAIELALQLGDHGAFGPGRFRQVAYEYGGFWPGLLKGWTENYPFQPWLMFVSYGFLHSGLLHLTVNMITLFVLAEAVLDRISATKFLLLYVAATVGGGLGHALLAVSYQPMVGASGALFGLAGAILAWEYVDRFTLRERLWPVARAVILLLALNVVLYYAMNRSLAWQAHLGGFLTGWMAALLIDPRGRAE